MYRKVNDNLIHKTAVIEWDYVTMGTGNTIGPYCSIGADAQHPTEKSEGIITIGDNNNIREYVSIHRPTKATKLTSIGSNCYFMEGTHIAHDCIVENYVRVSNKVLLAGNVHIMQGSVLGLGAIIHQGQVIGSYSMLGMGAIITKYLEVLPGYVYVGNPAKMLKPNLIGLERNGITKKFMDKEIFRFHDLKKKVK